MDVDGLVFVVLGLWLSLEAEQLQVSEERLKSLLFEILGQKFFKALSSVNNHAFSVLTPGDDLGVLGVSEDQA